MATRQFTESARWNALPCFPWCCDIKATPECFFLLPACDVYHGSRGLSWQQEEESQTEEAVETAAWSVVYGGGRAAEVVSKQLKSCQETVNQSGWRCWERAP